MGQTLTTILSYVWSEDQDGSPDLQPITDLFNYPTGERALDAFRFDPDATISVLRYFKGKRMLKEYRECVKGILDGYVDIEDAQKKEYKGLVDLSRLCFSCRNYKDFLLLFGTPWEDEMIEIFCTKLRMDDALSKSKFFRPGSIAKYAPTEKCHHDKKYDAVNKFCKVLGGNSGAWSKSKYRKFITKLRKNIDIVETKMSSGRWEEIEISKVPFLARKRYKEAFKRHGVSRKVKFEKTIHSNLDLIRKIDPCVAGHKNVQYDASWASLDRFTFQLGTFFENYLRSREIDDLVFVFGGDTTLYSGFWNCQKEDKLDPYEPYNGTPKNSTIFWHPGANNRVLFISNGNRHYIEGIDETLIQYFLSRGMSEVSDDISNEDYIRYILYHT